MTPADKAQAAQRILDDPLAIELLSALEAKAVEAMLDATTDQARRECGDTVRTVRAFRNSLKMLVTVQLEAARPRPGIA